jgi:molecular chaperone Hsp33
VRLLVVDYRAGELRGYVDFDAARLAALGANPSLFALFGRGYLAITFDLPGDGGRYQGVIPLEGESLAEICQGYFAQSEQVPTLIRLAVTRQGGRSVAGGLLAQHLPDGEEGRERLHVRFDDPEWEHIAVLAGSVRHDELVDPALTMEEIAWRLFHEEDQVRIDVSAPLGKGCRCSVAHFESVVRRFPPEDQAEMRGEDGHIKVDCAFCSKAFQLDM